MAKKKVVYVEPADYFPKELREKYKLGEFSEMAQKRKLEYLIKSVMFGHAVGDALGVPVEFCDRKELDKNPVVDMRGFGTYPYPAGTWSDDTSMSLCALEAMTHDDWNTSTVMDNFVKWLLNDEFTPTGETFDVGHTCFDAIMNYHLHKLPPRECGGLGEHSNGNGSLMRIHPFVLYGYAKKIRDFDWLALIDTASALTHAHERSKIACLIYGTVFNFIMMEPTKDKVREGIKFACDDFDYMDEFIHYSRLADLNFEHLSRDEIKSSGYVVDTLEAALWCLLTTDTYKECVLKAVNLGGDTDTIAAIAGGLAGALYGYDAIPEEWLNTLAKREYIEELCESTGWILSNDNFGASKW